MTHLSEIRDVIEKNMQQSRVYTLGELYDVVEKKCGLDREDFDPQAPNSNQPKWKRNVRNVLQKMKGKNLNWLGNGQYQRLR